MTPKQHLASILRFWQRMGTKKYLAGQQEHGGQLRYKRGMLAHCEEETWDLCAYLPTLRAQLKDIAKKLDEARLYYGEQDITIAWGLHRAIKDLDAILGPTVNKHLGEE